MDALRFNLGGFRLMRHVVRVISSTMVFALCIFGPLDDARADNHVASADTGPSDSGAMSELRELAEQGIYLPDSQFNWGAFRDLIDHEQYRYSFENYTPGESTTIILEKKYPGDQVSNGIGSLFGLEWMNRDTLTLNYEYNVENNIWEFNGGQANYLKKAPFGYWHNDPEYNEDKLKAFDRKLFGNSFRGGPLLSGFAPVSFD